MYKLLGLVRLVRGGGGDRSSVQTPWLGEDGARGEGDRSSVQTPHLGEDGARGGRATVAVYKLLGLVRMVHGGGRATVAVYKLLTLVRMVHGRGGG